MAVVYTCYNCQPHAKATSVDCAPRGAPGVVQLQTFANSLKRTKKPMSKTATKEKTEKAPVERSIDNKISATAESTDSDLLKVTVLPPNDELAAIEEEQKRLDAAKAALAARKKELKQKAEDSMPAKERSRVMIRRELQRAVRLTKTYDFNNILQVINKLRPEVEKAASELESEPQATK